MEELIEEFVGVGIIVVGDEGFKYFLNDFCLKIKNFLIYF